jgi:NADH:ubiquinone oxidoreductase subunit 3 (subunit A)
VSINKECILIEGEEPICRDVVDECEKLSDSKLACETSGAAVVVVVDEITNTKTKTELKCMWVNVGDFINGEEGKYSLCVWNKMYEEGGCSVIKDKHICENVDILFGSEYGCSWIKDIEGKELCINYNKSPECTYYTTYKGCLISDDGVCSWVKVGDEYKCIGERTGELCEYYVDVRGCTETSVGDVCKWNSTLGKCLGAIKSCEEYISYNGCNSVNERCFWNDISSTSEGGCLSLEKMYSCEDLSMKLCKNYSNIKGLTIDVEPCFYNYFSDDGGLHCVTTESVTNKQCSNIKTNKNVGDDSGPKYCDNAQLLFKIGGESGFGCEWELSKNECVNAILEGDGFPESCSEYSSADSCNYHLIKNGDSCFWNSIESDENENSCVGVSDVKACEEICTNDLSGINTYFCAGKVITESRSEMCKWGVSDETISHGCNCEGVDIPENCTLLNVSSPTECKQLISEKGKCFYNGDSDDKVIGVGICSDIGDITECSDILDGGLCTYAKKHTYYNLENYSSSSTAIFLCLWNTEESICQSKKIDNLVNKDEQKGLTWLLIVIIVVVVVVVLIVVVLVLIFVLRKVKSYSSNKKREYEMTAFPMSKDLVESTDNSDHISGFYLLFFWSILFFMIFSFFFVYSTILLF